ncbi:unnamed protein product [Rotaria sordida]|uniref:Cullin family profile domain-containing protein n=1 Tax=Rotaria sordida TaxID=392033 RepID=A0A818NS04_9BILA|nr:unnamed protein product [Rotaria sordida]CAF4108380.1 unnamed protein product [Rotaria sordida]
MASDALQHCKGKLKIKFIINIHEQCLKIVSATPNNKQIFIDCLDKGFRKFIKNKVVSTNTNSLKLARLLAEYTDFLLRQRNKIVEDTDFQENINKIMIIYNYLEDKDIFEKIYNKLLAKRLVNQWHTSNDNEELVIKKLQVVHHSEHILKMQQVLQDFYLSNNITNEYQLYCKKQNFSSIRFSVMVFNSHSFSLCNSSSLTLPNKLERILNSFTEFYNCYHTGRKLICLYEYSKGEIQTLFTKEKYYLQVSTYQMTIILLFNNMSLWKVKDIEDQTEINTKLLLQILCGLLKSKLFICTELDQNKVEEDLKETDINTNYTIKLNDSFTSKKCRKKLNKPVEPNDTEALVKAIDRDLKVGVVGDFDGQVQDAFAHINQILVEQYYADYII